MRPGDIVMVFGNPIKLTNPLGQARLVKKLPDNATNNPIIIEHWEIEFLDDEGHTYNQFIRNADGTPKDSQTKNISP